MKLTRGGFKFIGGLLLAGLAMQQAKTGVFSQEVVTLFCFFIALVTMALDDLFKY
jgi:hypothetical protein